MRFKKSLPPSSFIYTGESEVETSINYIHYNKDDYIQSKSLKDKEDFINWAIITGLSNTDLISNLCDKNNIDNLIVEDILNVSQRSKIDVKEDYIFSVLKSSYIENGNILHDYISIVLFKDKIFTFHEYDSDIFEPLIKRIKESKGIIRKMGHDYLYYAILDLMVDNNIEVHKVISSNTEILEEAILNYENMDQVLLYNARKELLYLKNNFTFFTDVFSKKFFENSDLINNNIDKYYKDLQDHITRLNQDINSERELISNLLDMHMNNISNKMNSIMKTLTIFSAIFIPLSFLAGFFGMNFTNFDSLANQNGIMYFIIGCFVIASGMVYFFKRRNWF